MANNVECSVYKGYLVRKSRCFLAHVGYLYFFYNNSNNDGGVLRYGSVSLHLQAYKPFSNSKIFI